MKGGSNSTIPEFILSEYITPESKPYIPKPITYETSLSEIEEQSVNNTITSPASIPIESTETKITVKETPTTLIEEVEEIDPDINNNTLEMMKKYPLPNNIQTDPNIMPFDQRMTLEEAKRDNLDEIYKKYLPVYAIAPNPNAPFAYDIDNELTIIKNRRINNTVKIRQIVTTTVPNYIKQNYYKTQTRKELQNIITYMVLTNHDNTLKESIGYYSDQKDSLLRYMKIVDNPEDSNIIENEFLNVDILKINGKPKEFKTGFPIKLDKTQDNVVLVDKDNTHYCTVSVYNKQNKQNYIYLQTTINTIKNYTPHMMMHYGTLDIDDPTSEFKDCFISINEGYDFKYEHRHGYRHNDSGNIDIRFPGITNETALEIIEFQKAYTENIVNRFFGDHNNYKLRFFIKEINATPNKYWIYNYKGLQFYIPNLGYMLLCKLEFTENSINKYNEIDLFNDYNKFLHPMYNKTIYNTKNITKNITEYPEVKPGDYYLDRNNNLQIVYVENLNVNINELFLPPNLYDEDEDIYIDTQQICNIINNHITLYNNISKKKDKILSIYKNYTKFLVETGNDGDDGNDGNDGNDGDGNDGDDGDGNDGNDGNDGDEEKKQEQQEKILKTKHVITECDKIIGKNNGNNFIIDINKIRGSNEYIDITPGNILERYYY